MSPVGPQCPIYKTRPRQHLRLTRPHPYRRKTQNSPTGDIYLFSYREVHPPYSRTCVAVNMHILPRTPDIVDIDTIQLFVVMSELCHTDNPSLEIPLFCHCIGYTLIGYASKPAPVFTGWHLMYSGLTAFNDVCRFQFRQTYQG